MEKGIPANTNQKQVGSANLLPQKTYKIVKMITRDKGQHSIVLEGCKLDYTGPKTTSWQIQKTEIIHNMFFEYKRVKIGNRFRNISGNSEILEVK